MTQINLLPWRERVREIKKKNFFVALVVAVGFAVFIIFLFHLYYDDLIDYQDKRNAFLQEEIARKQIEINSLRKDKEQQALVKAKLQFIMALREESYQAVRLLNELLQVVPDSITLSKLSRNGNVITLEGKAQSELAITAFLKTLSKVSIFNQPILTGINSQAGNIKTEATERFFQITVEQRGGRPVVLPQPQAVEKK